MTTTTQESKCLRLNYTAVCSTPTLEPYKRNEWTIRTNRKWPSQMLITVNWAERSTFNDSPHFCYCCPSHRPFLLWTNTSFCTAVERFSSIIYSEDIQISKYQNIKINKLFNVKNVDFFPCVCVCGCDDMAMPLKQQDKNIIFITSQSIKRFDAKKVSLSFQIKELMHANLSLIFLTDSFKRTEFYWCLTFDWR